MQHLFPGQFNSNEKVILKRAEGVTHGDLRRLKIAAETLTFAKSIGFDMVDMTFDPTVHQYYDTVRFFQNERLASCSDDRISACENWILTNLDQLCFKYGQCELEQWANILQALIETQNTMHDTRGAFLKLIGMSMRCTKSRTINLTNPSSYHLPEGRSSSSTGFAILDERPVPDPTPAPEPEAVPEPVAEAVPEALLMPVKEEEAPAPPSPELDEAELWAMHDELVAEEASHKASLQAQPEVPTAPEETEAWVGALEKALIEPTSAAPSVAPSVVSPTLSEMPDEELQEFLAMNAAALDGMNFQLPPAVRIKEEPDEKKSDEEEPPAKKLKIDAIDAEEDVRIVLEAMIGEQKPKTEKVQIFGGGNVLLKYDEAMIFKPYVPKKDEEPIDGARAFADWMKIWGRSINGTTDPMKHKHWFLFELRGVAANVASEIFGGENGIDKMFPQLLWDVMDVDLVQSVLVFKPKFQTLVSVVETIFKRKQIKYQAYALALPTGTAAREILIKMFEARNNIPFKRIATMQFCNEEAQEGWDSLSFMAVVGDDTPEQFASRVLEATIKAAGKNKLSNFEQLLCSSKVQDAVKRCKTLQDKKNEAAVLLRSVVKQLGDTTFWNGVPKWSDNTFDCMDKQGVYWEDDGDGFKEKRVSLREAVENPKFHMTRAMFFSGTSGIGKTTLVKSIARYWAAGYWVQDQQEKQGRPVELDEEAVHIIYTAAVQSLNITTNKGFMKQFVPIIVDDTDLTDAAMQKTGDSGAGGWTGLRAKYITQMLEVVNSGDVGARYKNVYFDSQQPRMFVANVCFDDWIPAVAKNNLKDYQAIKRRVIVFDFNAGERILPIAAREAFKKNLTDLSARFAAAQKDIRM